MYQALGYVIGLHSTDLNSPGQKRHKFIWNVRAQ